MNFEERMRAFDNYASDRGFISGIPNFHQQDYGKGTVFGGMLIPNNAAIRHIIYGQVLDTDTIGARFRSVDNYALANNAYYSGGYPNFHQDLYNGSPVFGAILFCEDKVTTVWVPLSDLGNPSDREATMRAAYDYARARGFEGGIPTFQGGATTTIKLIKPGFAFQHVIYETVLNMYERYVFEGIPRKLKSQIFIAQEVGFEKSYDCENLQASERTRLRQAYDRSLTFGTMTEQVCARTSPDLTRIEFNLELIQSVNCHLNETLIHEMMHVAGFRHPNKRVCQSLTDSNCDRPGDGGDYYGSPPLRAELCIKGYQDDAVDNDITPAIFDDQQGLKEQWNIFKRDRNIYRTDVELNPTTIMNRRYLTEDMIRGAAVMVAESNAWAKNTYDFLDIGESLLSPLSNKPQVGAFVKSSSILFRNFYSKVVMERNDEIMKPLLGAMAKEFDTRVLAYSSGTYSSSQLASDAYNLNVYMQALHQSQLPAAMKFNLVSDALSLLEIRANAVTKSNEEIKSGLTELMESDLNQQMQINIVSTKIDAVTGLYKDLKSELTDAQNQIMANTAKIDEVSKTMASNLDVIYNKLNQQDYRLERLDVLANVAFKQLTQINTMGLQKYDSSIKQHLAEYDQLLTKYSNDMSNNALFAEVISKGESLKGEIALRQLEVTNLQQGFNDFYGGLNLMAQFAQTTGNYELQKDIQIIHATSQIAIGIMAQFGEKAIGAAAAGAAAGAPLGPPGMIASGVMSLMSAAAADKARAQQSAQFMQAFIQLSNQIISLSNQVGELRNYTTYRFDRLERVLQNSFNLVEYKLYTQQQLITHNFQQTFDLLDNFYANMMRQFIANHNQLTAIENIVAEVSLKLNTVLNKIDDGFRAIYGQQMSNNVVTVVNYYDNQRYGQVPPLSENRVREVLLNLVHWAIDDTESPVLHGDLGSNYDLSTFLSNSITKDNVLEKVNLMLGMLRKQNLPITTAPLPANLTMPFDLNCNLQTDDATRVVNPIAYARTVRNILKLFNTLPEFKPQNKDRCHLQALIRQGQQFLELSLGLKTNFDPIAYFLNNYKQNLFDYIQFIYKEIVKSLEVTGEHIEDILSKCQAEANSVVLAQVTIKNDIEAIQVNVDNVYNNIQSSCYSCQEVLGDQRLPAVGQGYCSDPDHLPKHNKYPSACSAEAQQLSDIFDNIIPGASKYALGSAPAPSNSCQNFDNIRLIRKFSNEVKTSFEDAKQLLRKLEGIRNVLFDYNWGVNHTFTGGCASGGIYTFIDNLEHLSWAQFTAGVQTTYSNSRPFIDKYSDGNFKCKTTAYITFTIYQPPCAILDSFRGSACYHPNDDNYIEFGMDDHTQSVRDGVTRISEKLYTKAPTIKHNEESRNDKLNTLRAGITNLSAKLTKAKQLNMESLHYLRSPSEKQYGEMLTTIIDWMTIHSTAAERQKVLNELSQKQMAAGSELRNILNSLTINTRGLTSYLQLAFGNEFHLDEGSQLITRLMYEGDKLISDLLAPKGNNTNVSGLIWLRDHLKLPSAVNSTALGLPDYALAYYKNIVVNGQQALAEGKLLPGYDSLLRLHEELQNYRDYIFPQSDLSYRDITAQRVVSALRQNETDALLLINIPALKLVDVRDTNGNTPYLLVANDCDKKIAQALKDRDANVNAVDVKGESALNKANQGCEINSNRLDMLNLLLRHNVTACKSSNALNADLHQISETFGPDLVSNVSCYVPAKEEPRNPAIMGLAIGGGVVGLIVCILFVICMRLRRKQSSNHSQEDALPNRSSNSPTPVLPGSDIEGQSTTTRILSATVAKNSKRTERLRAEGQGHRHESTSGAARPSRSHSSLTNSGIATRESSSSQPSNKIQEALRSSSERRAKARARASRESSMSSADRNLNLLMFPSQPRRQLHGESEMTGTELKPIRSRPASRSASSNTGAVTTPVNR